MSKEKKDSAALSGTAEPMLAKEEPEGEKVAFKEENDEEYGQNMLYFHGFMLLSSFYLSMLLTNWGSTNITSDPSETNKKY